MKRTYLLLSLLLLSLNMVLAQDNGWFIGLESGFYHTQIEKNIISPNNRAENAFSTGFVLGKELNERFALRGILSFSRFKNNYKSGTLRWGTQHDGAGGVDPDAPSLEEIESAEFDWNYYYFNTRIGLNTALTQGRFRLVAFPFIEGNVYLTNNQTTRLNYGDGSTGVVPVSEDINTDFRKFNISAGLGLGLEAQLSSKVGLLLLPNASYMLLSTSVSPGDGPRFLSIGGTLGIHYKL